MLSHDAQEALARLRVVVAAGKPAPPDLARDALMALEPFADLEDRMYGRDEHIRRAALLIDGSTWARAVKLAKEAEAIKGIWHRLRNVPPEGLTLRGQLHAAALRYKLPTSDRGFFNIIDY